MSNLVRTSTLLTLCRSRDLPSARCILVGSTANAWSVAVQQAQHSSGGACARTRTAPQNAAFIRAFLVGHFKKVDYLICGDVLGALTETKALEPVMWQIVIASGDWVEEHPERARDIPAYTLAGLESGVRMYKNLRAVKPGVKHKLMDELLVRYENNTLNQWNAEHPCRSR